MSKCYEDLSRRGLIRLGHDFDEEHGGALQHYLADHADEYENIRPVETVIERADQIVETVSGPMRTIKRAFMDKDCKKFATTVFDTVVDNADLIKSGINAVSSLVSAAK